MAKKSNNGVGYGRPPVHSRFKAGQSGNPRGRPKGSLNFATDLKTTLLAPVALNDGGKPRRVTTQQAALFRLREKALRGDVRALDKLLSYAIAASSNATPDTVKSPSAEDAAILDAFRAQILAEATDDDVGDDDDGSDGGQ